MRTASDTLSARADIALFVGEIARRQPLPNNVQETPVFAASFADFAEVFAWERRPVSSPAKIEIPTSLGLAVASFFAEGGRACHVLSVGAPEPLPPPWELTAKDPVQAARQRAEAHAKMQATRLNRILPQNMPTADERTKWRGVAHLYGLPDVAMLLIPDLPDICAMAPSLVTEPKTTGPAEVFRPLGEQFPGDDPGARRRPPVSAPRLDKSGRQMWQEAVIRASAFLIGSRRGDVCFIAALPMSADDRRGVPEAKKVVADMVEGAGQVQLAYPWAESDLSARCPEGLQPTDGVLAGAIARTALLHGGFHSAGGQPLGTVRQLVPQLERRDIESSGGGKGDWLGENVSLIDNRRGLAEIWSDVTLSRHVSQRAGGVQRLRGILLRAARAASEDLVFEPSGEATWTRLRRRYEGLLTELWRLGALDGATPQEAFNVRCDRSTMTQSDIDNGRLVAVASFNPAQPIGWITIRLDTVAAIGSSRRAA